MEKGHVALFGHRDLVIQIPVKSPLTHSWMHRGAPVSWGCAISRIDTITTHFKTSLSGDTGRVPAECPLPLMAQLRLDLCLRSEEHTSELQSRQYLVCRL